MVGAMVAIRRNLGGVFVAPMPWQAKADSGMMETVPPVGTRGSITLALLDG